MRLRQRRASNFRHESRSWRAAWRDNFVSTNLLFRLRLYRARARDIQLQQNKQEEQRAIATRDQALEGKERGL